MQQKSLFVTPVALYEIVDGKTVEKGNCACAIVTLPSDRPKYSMVCYNDRRETLCVGALSSSNEHSIQFQLQASMYASFRDSTGKRWSFMFLKNAHAESFLAVLGIAFYALAGHPPHTTVISDFAPPSGEVRVGLQHRVRMRYSAFAIRQGEVLELGELMETNGDRPYNFQPVQSAMALHVEAKGFESSVTGMMEDSWRTVIVPATLPRAGRHLYGEDDVAFVLQTVRILHDDTPSDAAARVPTVFADTDTVTYANHNTNAPNALVPAGYGNRDANGTKIVVLHTERSGNLLSERAPVASNVGAEGAGIPAEHMALLQRLGVQVNGATTSARDVRDVASNVSATWRRSKDRPKPSAMTGAALEQAVRQLVLEHETLTDDVTRRDELIRSIDQRCRELQKRVDTAAMVSQQLMDEKSETLRGMSDKRLEKERELMRLQEQINQASHERDDIQRHLQTVKKLLAASDEELQQTRSRAEVHKIQSQSVAARLDGMQDAFAEERSRRKGLEAKVLALQEEIRNAEADLHVRTAQLEDIRRTADMERSHYGQLMENERQRRGFEAQQLREEIVTELQGREAKFQADRARVAEDAFKRGHTEGRVIGRREAMVDVATQMDELRLEAQRALSALDAAKTDLRRVTEEGMAQHRTLAGRVAELKRTLYEATRAKVRSEQQLHMARAKLRCADDRVLIALTAAAYRLRRPAAPADLLQLVDALQSRRPLDFRFQDADEAAEAAAATQRRVAWILEESSRLVEIAAEETFRAWIDPLAAAHDKTVAAVRQLWLERDGTAHYELNAAETRGRFTLTEEMEKFFADLSAFYVSQVEEREALRAAAAKGVEELLAAHTHTLSALADWRQSQLTERLGRSSAMLDAWDALLVEETTEFRRILCEVNAGAAAAAQILLMEDEERGRSAMDADQCAEYSGLLFDCRSTAELLLRAALVEWEAQSRAVVWAEEENAMREFHAAHPDSAEAEAMALKPRGTNETAPALQEGTHAAHAAMGPEPDEVHVAYPDTDAQPNAQEEEGEEEEKEHDVPATGGAVPTSTPVLEKGKQEDEAQQRAQDVEEALEEVKRPVSFAVPPQRRLDESSSDASAAAPPLRPSATVPPPQNAPKRYGLFGSSSSGGDDDDEEDANNANPKKGNTGANNRAIPPAKTTLTRRMPPPKSKLFDSSDSD